MSTSPLAPHSATPTELKAQLDAARVGEPFLIYRRPDGPQHIVPLAPERDRLSIGRRGANAIAFDWDAQVSRVHAELERLGDDWTITDDGLSSNGTYVNGIRIGGRRRLRDGDEIRIGTTVVAFRAPDSRESRTTLIPDELRAIPRLTETQLGVLVALARPYRDSVGFATPATNKEIAAELVLSVDGVKSNLRTLFQKFGVEDLPQNEKRARLVERAFQLGVVSENDL